MTQLSDRPVPNASPGTGYPPVPYDPELEPGLAFFLELVEGIPLRADTILANRAHFATIVPPIEQTIGDHPVEFEHRTVPGPEGAPDIELTIIRPRDATDARPRDAVHARPRGATDARPRGATDARPRDATDARPRGAAGARDGVGAAPGIYNIHGGGMVLGNRFFGVDGLIEDVLRFGAVGVTVEYRLAPEHPAPAAVEDCYAGLVWFAEHAEEFGVDPGRILVTGASAGGGLSAGVALLARDRGGPALAGQLLFCPMIDDRNETVSTRQYDGLGAWDRNNNDTAWNAILGPLRGTDRVSPYVAPARASDLSGLPPAYIDVGAAEIFRDEATDYALRIWAAGGQAELHVWAGGYHGFAGFSPQAEVSRAAAAARLSWLRRILEVPSRS